MLLAILYVACDAEEEEQPHCESFPEEAVNNDDNTLGIDQDCGYWRLAVGDYLAVSVHLTDDIEGHEAERLCDAVVGEGLVITGPDGTYTNLKEDGPKWTVQVFGDAPTELAALDIACFEDTEWQARVLVE